MSSNEERSLAQVRRLFNALGRPDARIYPQLPPRPDVLLEIDGKRILIETTDYHGDEADRGGSALRKQEQQDAEAGRTPAYWVPVDPLPNLTRRINAKVSKSYDITGADEFWLAIFAGVPQLGAADSTFLFTPFLNEQNLNTKTASLLENSRFSRCVIFCELAVDGSRLYSWQRGAHWREVPLPRLQTDSKRSPTFWDIQKLFKKL